MSVFAVKKREGDTMQHLFQVKDQASEEAHKPEVFKRQSLYHFSYHNSMVTWKNQWICSGLEFHMMTLLPSLLVWDLYV